MLCSMALFFHFSCAQMCKRKFAYFRAIKFRLITIPFYSMLRHSLKLACSLKRNREMDPIKINSLNVFCLPFINLCLLDDCLK